MIVRWKGNDQYVELLGLKDSLTKLAVNDATVKVQFRDKDLVAVGGLQTLAPAGSGGDYRVILLQSVNFPDTGAPFTALVTVDRVGGTHEESVEDVQVMQR